jgi:hypothetical protein
MAGTPNATLQDVSGNGQKLVRNIWTNLAVSNLNSWMHTLVELGAGHKTQAELCDRRPLAEKFMSFRLDALYLSDYRLSVNIYR